MDDFQEDFEEHDIDDLEESGQCVHLNLQIEVYLRERDDPIQCYSMMHVARAAFDEAESVEYVVEDVVGQMTHAIMSDLDTASERLLPFVDSRGNRTVVRSPEVQAVSILVPDIVSVIRELGEGYDDTSSG